MIESWYVLKVYTQSEFDSTRVLACEVPFETFPTDEQIDATLRREVGADGVAEVVKRYRTVMPFA